MPQEDNAGVGQQTNEEDGFQPIPYFQPISVEEFIKQGGSFSGEQVVIVDKDKSNYETLRITTDSLGPSSRWIEIPSATVDQLMIVGIESYNGGIFHKVLMNHGERFRSMYSLIKTQRSDDKSITTSIAFQPVAAALDRWAAKVVNIGFRLRKNALVSFERDTTGATDPVKDAWITRYLTNMQGFGYNISCGVSDPSNPGGIDPRLATIRNVAFCVTRGALAVLGTITDAQGRQAFATQHQTDSGTNYSNFGYATAGFFCNPYNPPYCSEPYVCVDHVCVDPSGGGGDGLPF
jgi:hypothetical protein